MSYEDVTITDNNSISHKGHASDVQYESVGGYGFVPIITGLLAVPKDTQYQIQITDLIIDEENYSEDIDDFEKIDIVFNGKTFKNCRKMGGGLTPAEVGGGRIKFNGTVIYRGFLYNERGDS